MYRYHAVLKHTFFLGVVLRLELELPSGLVVRARITKEEYEHLGLEDGREVSFQIRSFRVLPDAAAELPPETDYLYTPPPSYGENI
jgi:hypothetical protein